VGVPDFARGRKYQAPSSQHLSPIALFVLLTCHCFSINTLAIGKLWQA